MEIHFRAVASTDAKRAVAVDRGFVWMVNAEVVDLYAVSVRLGIVRSALL